MTSARYARQPRISLSTAKYSLRTAEPQAGRFDDKSVQCAGRRCATDLCRDRLVLHPAGYRGHRDFAQRTEPRLGCAEPIFRRAATVLGRRDRVRPNRSEAILRWSSPVQYMRRTLTRDVDLGGVNMSKGQKGTMWFVSANRDDTTLLDAWTFDLRRHPKPHFACSTGGPPLCLGAGLARREISAMFEELHRKTPDIAPVGEPVPLLLASCTASSICPWRGGQLTTMNQRRRGFEIQTARALPSRQEGHHDGRS
ncbi:hypothetical protein ACVWWN_003465 [Mycobacterium sp. URHB0021]